MGGMDFDNSQLTEVIGRGTLAGKPYMPYQYDLGTPTGNTTPVRVRGLWANNGNLISNVSNQNSWFNDILPQLEIFVAVDMVETDTTRYADYVLPACHWFESLDIGVNSSKRGLLTPERRMQLIRDTFAGEPRIEPVLYEGLTGDMCRSLGIRHILRGLRNSADFEYEHDMEMANALVFPEITTVAIFTPAEYIPVSSRLVREIITMGGDPAMFLPSGIDIKKYLTGS